MTMMSHIKKGLSTTSVLIVSCVFLIANSSTYAETCTLKARVTNVPPLYYQNEAKQWTGLTVDLSNALLKEAGCTADYEQISWARSLNLMKTGGIDMMMNLSMTESRKEFIHFIGPQNDETTQLVIRKMVDTKIESLDDFKNLPGEIGYQQGSFYGKAFHEKIKSDPVFNSKFVAAFSHEINIRKLRSGRIIGILGHNYSGVSSEIELLKQKRFKTHPFVINKDQVYFGFSKKSVSHKILDRLEKAYLRATDNGAFKRVIESYK